MFKMKRTVAAACVLLIATSVFVKKNKVTQQKAGTEDIASEYWNASDIQHVCEDLINKCATSPRVKMFMDKNNRLPRVKIDPIINNSTERISSQMMVEAFSDAVINSGVLTIVASNDEVAALRAEVADQQDHASEETAKEEFKSIRAQTGAGGMLNDNLHNYMANSYELLVTDVFNALNYYNQGDLDNAHATLRMLEERQQQYEGIYGNILEEEQPDAESQSSMDNALKTAGLNMKAIMNNGGAPKKPTDADKYKDSAFAYYVGMVIRTMKGNTDNQFDAKKLAALNSAFASAYNDETNIPAGQGRVDVLSLAGKIVNREGGNVHFEIPGLAVIAPAVMTVTLDDSLLPLLATKFGEDMFAASLAGSSLSSCPFFGLTYTFPKYAADKSDTVKPVSITVGDKTFKPNMLESFDAAVQKDVALNAHRAFVRIVWRSTAKKVAAIGAAGVTIKEANDKMEKLPPPLKAKALGAGVVAGLVGLNELDKTEVPDVRQCSYLPKAAYAGGIDLAPGEYDVVVEYSNGTKDTKHITVQVGKTTLVESVCLK